MNSTEIGKAEFVLPVKKIYGDSVMPLYATAGSACFDICAYAGASAVEIRAWDYTSVERRLPPMIDVADSKEDIAKAANCRYYLIPPRYRALVPTGIKFHMRKPFGFNPFDGRIMIPSVRIRARSGLSTKGGVCLVNGVGVIDCDYADEVFVPIHNITDHYITITHGARIAQGEVVVRDRYEIVETSDDVCKTTERNGGFGSTGV
jgi:deoxyuridine 5'-triphosphate nucleotidohydrolase